MAVLGYKPLPFGRLFLSLHILPEPLNQCAASGSGEVAGRPEVCAKGCQLRELLAQHPNADTFEVVHQRRDREHRQVLDQQLPVTPPSATRFRHSPERILAFGDSFSRDLSTLLSSFFFQVVFLRTPFYHPDVAAQKRPTIVIAEHVERYLSKALPDEDRPNFLLIPLLKDGAYRPSTEFASAFSAILSFGRPPTSRLSMGLVR